MQTSYIPTRVKIKNFIKKYTPIKFFTFVQTTWRKTLAPLFSGRDLMDKYTRLYLGLNSKRVKQGPFAGMQYIEDSAGSAYLLKIIGCYEEVLHPKIEILKSADLDTLIDIGCAEGYYLVGLGLHKPQVKLIGYDIDERALDLTTELYNRNNLQNRHEFKKECTASSLQADITAKTALICDAEGFEDSILDVEKTPALTKLQYLLVETHEWVAPNIIPKLTDMFSPTHDIEVITFKHANPGDYAFLKNLDIKISYELLRERGEQEQKWLFMTKRD